ncbi:hypothetical protein VTI74DRAFT_7431 [Chaetomium olivicolor]
MAAGGQPGGAALEERLRSLILANSNSDSQPASQTQNGSPQPSRQHADQAAQDNSASSSSPPTHDGAPSSKGNRKRPNQAQRRQMSAQLSIPIDPRPHFHQSQRSFADPAGHLHQRHGRTGHHRIQEPRSATFRPPSRGNEMQSAPVTGMPFTPRPRHQPSLSYHGPAPMPNSFGWSQPPIHHGDPRLAHQMTHQMPGVPHMPPPPLPFDAPSPMHLRQHSSSDLDSPGMPAKVSLAELRAQAELLEGLCRTIVAGAEIEPSEIVEKESFRAMIEKVARCAIAEYERTHNGIHDFPPESVQLKCFGSLASGFATKASDMDLGILSPLSRIQPDAPGSPIPRLIEKAFLDLGFGARLLTQTRVPIIKVCEKPPEHLRLSLLEARAKWERGLTEDHEDEEAPEIHDGPEQHPAGGAQAEAPLQDDTLTQEERLQAFKQSEGSSLSAYYGSAKRLIRKLGGRDITHSNIAEFKAEDVRLLNQVCLAFVDGLANNQLRERLLRYRSLNRYDLISQPNLRSLLGLFTQVEGEHMAMLWDSRPIRERDSSREAAAERTVKAWRDIQNRPEYGRDPLSYQKELQLGVEQLKRIPSIQVLLLAQAHNESAANYCSRALKLQYELSLNDPKRLPAIAPTVIQHYIAGIWNRSVREAVAEFTQSHNIRNLRVVGRRHKSLQLAHEYETCLDKGVYPDAIAAKVRQYVELLRVPTAKGRTNAMIPLPPDSAPLLAEIRLLGDPSRASPNQPRDRYSSALEFPKSGVGVQCDINFSAHLAVQNTLLLRCYSHCDPRVRPLVLFVKHWAKVRRINTPYRGTLGSYGYSLMMLHYLVNVAQPFVCPNLQQLARPPDPNLPPHLVEETVTCKGRNVQFWRDEGEIIRLAQGNALTQNRESIGELLRGFFEYYAKGGAMMSLLPCRSFDWGRDVLSLRTHGGLLSKQAKGWTGAKTVVEVTNPGAAAANPQPELTAPASELTSTIPGQEQQQQQQQPPSHHPHTTQFGLGQQPQPQPQPTQSQGQLETKEIRYRYLFAIEDPFELDHNVARTVTHAGIVKIRDEFRRAWRIIKAAGRNAEKQQNANAPPPGGSWKEEDLLEDAASAEEAREREQFERLLDELHGVNSASGTGIGGGDLPGEGEGDEREGSGEEVVVA